MRELELKNKEKALKYFDQSIFIESDKTSSKKAEYLSALEVIFYKKSSKISSKNKLRQDQRQLTCVETKIHVFFGIEVIFEKFR